MTPFGIRKRLKSAIKDALGVEKPQQSQPFSGQSPSAQRTVESSIKAHSEPVEEQDTSTESTEAPSFDDVPVASSLEITEEVPKAAAAVSGLTEDGLALTTENVQEILDDYVRPGLQSDGGDITLIKIENNDIFVQLVGACSTCPSSIATMKMGVEMLLKEEFPSLNEVIDVTALSHDELEALTESA